MFYTKRTAQEQANRLPPEKRQSYLRTQLDKIEIDGIELTGYFEYSYFEEKSYVEQPTRAQDGSIGNLDDIPTIVVPRLIIKYNMMSIEDYRALMIILKTKNAHTVTCYDIVTDKRVTHEMYVAPMQMPQIYQQYLSVLGIRDCTIEMIGTGVTQEYSILYDTNLPKNLTSEYQNIPSYFVSTASRGVPAAIAVPEMDINGWYNLQSTDGGWYHLEGWAIDRNGSVIYNEGSQYIIGANCVIYAVWSYSQEELPTPEIDIMKFKINGVSYTAQKAMTWQQWVESSYNIDGWYITTEEYISNGNQEVVWDNVKLVHKSDSIQSGFEYETVTY